MRYYLDTEFDGFGGILLSLALVREDGESLYLAVPDAFVGPAGGRPLQEWVAENVWPILENSPVKPQRIFPAFWGEKVAEFLNRDSEIPVIFTDWPDDIRYFCEVLITGPGKMISIPGVQFDMVRVDAYPTTLPGAVQHNAWWDAMTLRHMLT